MGEIVFNQTSTKELFWGRVSSNISKKNKLYQLPFVILFLANVGIHLITALSSPYYYRMLPKQKTRSAGLPRGKHVIPIPGCSGFWGSGLCCVAFPPQVSAGWLSIAGIAARPDSPEEGKVTSLSCDSYQEQEYLPEVPSAKSPSLARIELHVYSFYCWNCRIH